ncbi:MULTISPECIES: HisA/HisF-related TIM barrel protein [unclassified Oleiphilus]|uniref:1-(5-phosphoribosyl)-5-[(5- phosphoribosylamino)methylideneamino]imidazole-4- carboxamide isomerase n=3 Tax=Oleiphilus TaxID=141450 RepID=UPI0007C3D3E9|nr:MULTISPECIES: HisA/HisF-related TIM barrel protein [unclassified Oleiphilus]KZY41615.1 hypothetical protein A3732_17785 [Oleiphilus sp. HI0050]KZY75745.1 hypothetical protein A3740_14650 [Oleiphilus sp. HI0068]KZY87334.1 hypothetical protein A3743_02025 [Oleiphilus sp. HI0072]KZZ19146.1 hypothetical protein A3752_15460 [Oleiphilus sp. HI0081]KZY65562.1 hypothetical protein A3735_24065 [Oleiphilus sp. HI0061]
MNILPSINLMQAKCVHVSGHHLDQTKVYSDDATDLAGRWMDAGVQDLYVFDVDGAIQGRTAHAEMIVSIAQRFPNLNLHVEGGIRSESEVEHYLKSGIRTVTLGTKAIEDPAFIAEMCKRFPERITVSLSLLEGQVCTHGCQKTSPVTAETWAQQLSAADISALVYRDLGRIGSCQGVNLDEAIKLAEVSRVPLWVTGGVADMDDIRALYSESEVGIETVLVSRALDEKALSLKEAQDYCED